MLNESPTVGEILRSQAHRRGDHPLLICDAERVSYAEADRLSAQLARGLVALGAGKGSHVGLLYPNSVAFVVGMLRRESVRSSYRSPRSPPGGNCASNWSTATPRSFSPRCPSDPTTTCNG